VGGSGCEKTSLGGWGSRGECLGGSIVPFVPAFPVATVSAVLTGASTIAVAITVGKTVGGTDSRTPNTIGPDVMLVIRDWPGRVEPRSEDVVL
jgi:hypothetical protein